MRIRLIEYYTDTNNVKLGITDIKEITTDKIKLSSGKFTKELQLIMEEVIELSIKGIEYKLDIKD